MSGACIQRCIVRNVFFYSTFTNVLYSCHVFNVFDILKFFLERFLHLCQKLGRGITPPPLMRHLALLIDNISMFLCLSSGNQGGLFGENVQERECPDWVESSDWSSTWRTTQDEVAARSEWQRNSAPPCSVHIDLPHAAWCRGNASHLTFLYKLSAVGGGGCIKMHIDTTLKQHTDNLISVNDTV